jgi:hypothetical protein
MLNKKFKIRRGFHPINSGSFSPENNLKMDEL